MNGRRAVIIIATVLIAFPASVVNAVTPGSLDPSFGQEPRPGVAITNIAQDPDFPDQAHAVAVQTDGKIIAAGTAIVIGQSNNFALVRYNGDGSIDTSFGVDGIVLTDFGHGANRPDQANAVVVQPDGKIVAAGESRNAGDIAVFGLARYNTDGSLDTSFGIDGLVQTEFAGFTAAAYALALQPDGKIVAAGTMMDGMGNGLFALARYNTDGSPDADFGVGGEVTTAFTGDASAAYALALQPDGKIVVAGTNDWTGTGNFALARYDTDGSLDTDFGVEGKIITSVSENFSEAYGLVVQSDGKIVAVGIADLDFALARYNADGSLDTDFGIGGLVTTDFDGGVDVAYAAALLPDGKILAAGSAGGDGGDDFALAKYNTDGSLDEDFGGGALGPKPGTVVTDFAESTNSAFALALTAGGKKAVVVGIVEIDENNQFALAQYFIGDNPGRASSLVQAIQNKYCNN
jgi:uncharacterized delta-60 repeat protein